MNGYKYETHLHTREASKCGSSTGAEQVRFMKSLGYQGIVVTDHFFNGNTAIDRSLPWEERVERYCAGYKAAKEEGNRTGLDVFFGIEWNFHNDEYLLYGVDKEWLLANPQMLEWTHRQLFDQIDSVGGLMIQAHPFRVRNYVGGVHLYPQLVHGIEVTNACNNPQDDHFAKRYAEYFHLPETSGSDLHRAEELPRGIRGVLSEQRWDSLSDYIRQVKTRSGYRIITSPDAVGLQKEDKIPIPADMQDAEERDITDRLLEIFGDRFPATRFHTA